MRHEANDTHLVHTERPALNLKRRNERRDGLSGPHRPTSTTKSPTDHTGRKPNSETVLANSREVEGREADLICVGRDSGSQSTKLPAAMPRFKSPIPPRAQDSGEPEKEWKRNGKQRLENELETQLEQAKERLERNMQSIRGMGPQQEAERAYFIRVFKSETAAIREHALARQHETDRSIRAATTPSYNEPSISDRQPDSDTV